MIINFLVYIQIIEIKANRDNKKTMDSQKVEIQDG